MTQLEMKIAQANLQKTRRILRGEKQRIITAYNSTLDKPFSFYAEHTPAEAVAVLKGETKDNREGKQQ